MADQVETSNGSAPSWMPTNLEQLRNSLENLAVATELEQFHTPRNLLLALVGEVGKLSELFQWKGEVSRGVPEFKPNKKLQLSQELADVLLHLIRLADMCGVDLGKVAVDKMKANANKPVSEKGMNDGVPIFLRTDAQPKMPPRMPCPGPANGNAARMAYALQLESNINQLRHMQSLQVNGIMPGGKEAANNLLALLGRQAKTKQPQRTQEVPPAQTEAHQQAMTSQADGNKPGGEKAVNDDLLAGVDAPRELPIGVKPSPRQTQEMTPAQRMDALQQALMSQVDDSRPVGGNAGKLDLTAWQNGRPAPDLPPGLMGSHVPKMPPELEAFMRRTQAEGVKSGLGSLPTPDSAYNQMRYAPSPNMPYNSPSGSRMFGNAQAHNNHRPCLAAPGASNRDTYMPSGDSMSALGKAFNTS